ncbi:MAG TPA: ATP-dependent Clp protease adaptor ClpS [Bacteroidia bacterium]|nr:ATP-dependent Clp protease adaptor ClpS [Bacteroidia bacterium]HRS58739.1 ATP-dependent Clp protease adaptor ClpS [Bacteroidia bacterium]HRU67927.1 ATP-dependent Clp protease adaptor ClpS [Bacteroidia bacterium]
MTVNNPDNQSERINIHKNHQLILHNDDVNTFDFVIKTLMDICHFDEVQAEQIALLTHFKGETVIKHGDKNYLTALKLSLEEAGLTVSVG